MANDNLLIEGIWIIRNYAGICLYEAVYTDFKQEGISKDLITGLLSAIVSFSVECFNDKLEFIKFKNHKIILKFENDLLYIVAISLEPSIIEQAIYERINLISDTFSSKFKTILENERWDGSIEIFKTFSEDLQKIVQRKPLNIRLLKEKMMKRLQKKRQDRILRRKDEIRRLHYQQ
ncbi:MAG: hypothetical protein ACTSR8_04630 [Promethearchaeota archaeon]